MAACDVFTVDALLALPDDGDIHELLAGSHTVTRARGVSRGWGRRVFYRLQP